MMKSFHVFGQDLKSAFKKPKVFIPILVVLFIPVLYSGLFLNAFWDPYGKMNELPVAVVNTDQGAVYNDKSGYWEVEFNNKHNGYGPKSGVVNKYKDGNITSREGLTGGGGEPAAGNEGN